MYAFNLVDEPWIPCVSGTDETPREQSLVNVLTGAHEISAIADPSPLTTFAIHRLLLAVLHRVFGPESPDAWFDLWSQGSWDASKITEYLNVWQHRFDLFDGEAPFYQTAALDLETYERSVVALLLQVNLADRTLFEHTTDTADLWLDPAHAAREVITHQAIALGGLITYDDRAHKSAKGASLAKGAMTLVRGNNLFETLMLNLHMCNSDADLPFNTGPDDRPAWERDEPTQPDERTPTGYLDYLTWQSRRIKLHPETMPNGQTGVRSVVIMKGYALPDWWNDQPRDPSLGYRRQSKASGKANPWDPITFRVDRAFWRDSLPLFQSLQSGSREFRRPLILDWLSDLSWEYGYLDKTMTHSVDVYGLSSDRMKIHLWRQEQFPVPTQYLDNEPLFSALQLALDRAEDVGSVVRNSVWYLAKLLLAPNSDLEGGRDPDRNAVSDLAESFEASRDYWAQLDRSFSELLVNLADDRTETQDRYTEYGREVLPQWFGQLRGSAISSFERAIAGLDLSSRELKAAAKATRLFRIQLAKALKDSARSDGEE